MKLTQVSFSAKAATSSLSKLMKPAPRRILTPNASTIVTPTIGFQAAMRTVDMNRKASSVGGATTTVS